MGTDDGKTGLMKKSMYGTRDAASNWGTRWQEACQGLKIQTRIQLEESVPP